MKTAILSVGTELLFGQITNTNTVYLSQQLNMMGFDVMYHYTVGDNPERVAEMIELAFKDCDIVLTTGGLGPTQDDLTKEVACKVMGDELVMKDDVLEELIAMFKKNNRIMTDNNRKQAEMPSRAVVFKNDAGTAPGFALENDGKYIICMPGPPREMTRMFEKTVKPFLQDMSNQVIHYKMVRTFGIGESQLETELLGIIDGQTDPTIATYAKEGESSVRIASKRDTLKEAEEAVNEMLARVEECIGQYIYSTDDEELVEVVCKKLIDKGLTLSSAESCTGGMFAASVTNVAGVSACFDRGIVTYSNQAKMDELGVSEETLEKYGAVSAQTAMEMAEGLAKVSGSDVCISVTGIAGPGGGTEEKPVGLVYLGLCYNGEVSYKELRLRNMGRKWIRQVSVLNMLDLINKNI